MEDILASIRRILSEEEESSSEPKPQTSGPVAEDVLLLDTSMMVPEDSQPQQHPQEPPASPSEPPAAKLPEQPVTQTGLLAPETAKAATEAVGELVRRLSSERHAQVHTGGPTIEDVVRAELRPMLKAWLDEHLAPLVERLVRAEIERVVGRAVL